MSNHTPGPWEAFPKHNPREIKTEFGHPGMDISELLPVMTLGPGKNSKANAHLIAAAPEMFSLLKKHIRELYETSDTDRAIEALIARIEKSSDE